MASTSNPDQASQGKEPSDELDALLDDALSDFEKTKPVSTKDDSSVSKDSTSVGAACPDPDVPIADLGHTDAFFEELLNDDNIMQMTKEFSSVLEQLAEKDPDMMNQFQKFSTEAAVAAATGGEMPTVDENVSRAISELSKNFQEMSKMEHQEKTDLMEEQILKAMGGLNMAGESADASGSADSIGENMTGMFDSEGFMDMMQGMMKNLLSKELLYPSLCEIRERYPAWLEANKTHAEYDKYAQQSRVVEELCSVFDAEKEDDSEQVKKERMSKVVDLMQQMQQYGHPPPDMMADVGGDPMPGADAPPECCLM